MATIDPAVASRCFLELEADLDKNGRLGKPRRYLAGDQDLPYMPKGAKAEYAHLAGRSITPWLSLIPNTFARSLFVDGFRPAKGSDQSAAWSYWQANGLDARQTVAHRGALEYGTSYALILPGTLAEKRVPFWRPLSPLRSAAWYRDDDDEFPELALRDVGTTTDGARLIELFDAQNRYTFARPKDATDWIASKVESHGLGVTPFVRFRDRLDGEAVGVVRPLIGVQDRINEIVFSTLIAMQYASFRQRWATGLAIPVVERTVDDPDNPGQTKVVEEPIQPFEAAVNRLWVSEDSETKFGDFAQTEMSGHHQAYTEAVRTLAGIAQVSPNVLTGDLVNLSAEALAQMESATQRKVSELETIFGEAWESGFRLAARAAGAPLAEGDDSEVRWRDTEARSFAATVDGLGKIATMLRVPPAALWERIPGVTDKDVERWKALQTVDPLDALTGEIARQTALSSAASEPLAEAPAEEV